jgi:hypothetical protein
LTVIACGWKSSEECCRIVSWNSRITAGYGCFSDARWPQQGASRRSRPVPLRWGLRRGRCGGKQCGLVTASYSIEFEGVTEKSLESGASNRHPLHVGLTISPSLPLIPQGWRSFAVTWTNPTAFKVLAVLALADLQSSRFQGVRVRRTINPNGLAVALTDCLCWCKTTTRTPHQIIPREMSSRTWAGR